VPSATARFSRLNHDDHQAFPIRRNHQRLLQKNFGANDEMHESAASGAVDAADTNNMAPMTPVPDPLTKKKKTRSKVKPKAIDES
jgi:hypothetical protein